jgi:hypothetical protein
VKALPLFVLTVLAGGGGAPPAAHPLHLSTAQIAVEGNSAHMRIRLFKNDIEAALAAAHGLDSIRLSPTPSHDSMFIDYFQENYELTLNGARAIPAIVASGEDHESGDGEERIWWVQLQYVADDSITQVGISARVLFEWFEDQRNIVRILHVATDKQRTLYFAAPEEDWVNLTFE